jgi:hypothetical protein
MAGYAIASIPASILFTFSMRLFVKGMTEGAIKGWKEPQLERLNTDSKS